MRGDHEGTPAKLGVQEGAGPLAGLGVQATIASRRAFYPSLTSFFPNVHKPTTLNATMTTFIGTPPTLEVMRIEMTIQQRKKSGIENATINNAIKGTFLLFVNSTA